MEAAAIYLCQLDELADREARGFDPLGSGQDSVLLVRQGLQLYAYRDLCPHYGDTPMAWRRHAYLNAQRSHIVCAAHGALFEIANGACVRGPCLGQSLSALHVEIRDDGGVLVYL
ncbi:Rieske (2Fe-2S) protein [Oxalobacteraceae bacterium]|nr:Rieske (2Fe-2S) protein [Oxalobacteraceae bacterium]